MKKFLVCLLFWMQAGVAVAQNANVLNASLPENRAKKIEWIYAALSNVVDGMYKCWQPVSLPDLVPMVNHLIDNDAHASLDELVAVCRDADAQRVARAKLSRSAVSFVDGCNTGLTALNWPNTGMSRNLTAAYGELGDFCGLFIENLMNEQFVVMRRDIDYKYAGTYVTRVFGDDMYAVINVVLADGYKKNGVINQDVNTAPENTRIWEVLQDGTVRDMAIHTATNDMFLNTMQSNDVRGIFNHSFICMNSDVTDDVLQMFNAGRGAPGYSITSAIKLFPDSSKGKAFGAVAGHLTGGAASMADSSYMVGTVAGAGDAGKYDLKRSLAHKCKIEGQGEAASHTNGVLFDGKIVNLEWLGHFLFGMIREETVPDDNLENKLRATLQSMDGGGDDEPEHLKFAADMGSQLHQEKIAANIDRRFEKTQTKNPQMAHDKVKNVLSQEWGVAKADLRCGNNCNKIGTDVVWCTYQDKRREFTFDDVANGVFVLCSEIVDK